MKHLLLTLLLATLCATGYGQTIKSLGYNTTNGQIVAATNVTWTNAFTFSSNAVAEQVRTNLGLGSVDNVTFADIYAQYIETSGGTNFVYMQATGLVFGGSAASGTRFGLALGWPALTNSNAATSLLGLNASNQVVAATNIIFTNGVAFTTNAAAATLANLGLGTNASVTISNLNVQSVNISNVTNFRAAIGLGETNDVTFAQIYADAMFLNGPMGATGNFTNTGNIVINQSTTNNGLFFIYRTNNEPFLGLANLIASNNTTISNETLFRVGVAEATNKAAQFGFRSTNTNGDGVAVFSTFGYNALMMIGPSARSATNASVEADIYSISPTNKVATLIDTNTGATLMHRPVGFNTNASAPANTTNVAGWIQIYVGTNNVRVPYYE
jgi:hypothetical protein